MNAGLTISDRNFHQKLGVSNLAQGGRLQQVALTETQTSPYIHAYRMPGKSILEKYDFKRCNFHQLDLPGLTQLKGKFEGCKFVNCRFPTGVLVTAHFKSCTFLKCTFDTPIFGKSCLFEDCSILNTKMIAPKFQARATLVGFNRFTNVIGFHPKSFSATQTSKILYTPPTGESQGSTTKPVNSNNKDTNPRSYGNSPWTRSHGQHRHAGGAGTALDCGWGMYSGNDYGYYYGDDDDDEGLPEPPPGAKDMKENGDCTAPAPSKMPETELYVSPQPEVQWTCRKAWDKKSHSWKKKYFPGYGKEYGYGKGAIIITNNIALVEEVLGE